MKKTITFFCLTILCFTSTCLLGQDVSNQRYSIEVKYGLSRTLHYSEPVNIDLCFEGCFAEKQKSKLASSIDVSLYKRLKRNSSLKIGIGLSEYRFEEMGSASIGNSTFFPYEKTREFNYIDLSFGYRSTIETGKLIKPFFEAELIYQILTAENNFLKKSGVAIKPQIGALLAMSDKVSIIMDGFFKTGVVNYNEVKLNEDYIPFGYGLELGVNIQI